jgi:esterase/lipase superfamily enzyme
MTPTWTLILLVFVFWTYPATAAVIAYRVHGSSIENVKAAFETTLNDVSKALSLDALSIDTLDLDPLNLQFKTEA